MEIPESIQMRRLSNRRKLIESLRALYLLQILYYVEVELSYQRFGNQDRKREAKIEISFILCNLRRNIS